MKPKIVVIGSANMDMIVRTACIPKPGETVLGNDFIQSMGGKGANQAIAATRLGADVTFVARLGKDHFGQDAFEAYGKEGIDTKYIVWDEETPTGVALIMIDNEGENIICVTSGANGKLSTEDVSRAEEAIKSADCVLLQLEIPMKTVEHAIRLASKYHVRVVLNPAPMANLSNELLGKVDVLTPNITEAAKLSGVNASEPRDLAVIVKKKFNIKNVIVTMGKEGTAISSEQGSGAIYIPSYQVDAVDATGAGDAFNGGLVVAWSQGKNLEDAVRYANAVGALSTTHFGAQSALPTAEEVRTFLNMNEKRMLIID
jgi:ribokinase